MATRVLSSRLARIAAEHSSRRSYTAAAAAAAARQEPAVAADATAAAARTAVAAEGVAKEEFFWMRDPKTGCWMPENRFNDVDVADLRAQALSKKR